MAINQTHKITRSSLAIILPSISYAFEEVPSNQNLAAHKINFQNAIINFLVVNGTIGPAMLFESPFTDLNSGGILAVFDETTSGKIISLIEQVNRNADVA